MIRGTGGGLFSLRKNHLLLWGYLKGWYIDLILNKRELQNGKKTIDQQIKEKQTRLDELDTQAKAIQDEKRAIKKDIKQLNDALVAELGRSLLAKMNLETDEIDQAFAELNHLPIDKQVGGQDHGNQ